MTLLLLFGSSGGGGSVTQTVTMQAIASQTGVSIRLRSQEDGSIVATETAAESSSGSGVYSADFTDIPAGTYWVQLIRTATGVIIRSWTATLTLSTDVFPIEGGVDGVDVIAISGNTDAADTLELFTIVLKSDTGQIDDGTFAEGAIDSQAIAASAAAEIRTGLATSANQTIILDGIGYLLAQEVGAVADAQTAAAVYVRSWNGSTYTITHAGLTSAGVRGTASLAKS